VGTVTALFIHSSLFTVEKIAKDLHSNILTHIQTLRLIEKYATVVEDSVEYLLGLTNDNLFKFTQYNSDTHNARVYTHMTSSKTEPANLRD
jgi:hypothetical protein